MRLSLRAVLASLGLPVAAVAAVAAPAHSDFVRQAPPSVAVGLAVDPESFAGIKFFQTDNGHVYLTKAEGTDVWRYALSTEGNEIFFESALGIWRMGFNSNSAELFIEDGKAPAVSNNGRYLAYAVTQKEYDPGYQEGLAVRDLATGDERSFPNPEKWDNEELDAPSIDQMAVSNDGRYVAFSYWDGGEILVLDTTTADDLTAARPLLSPSTDPDQFGPYYNSPVFLADGRVAAAELEGSIVAVDPTGAGQHETLASGLGHIEALDVDSTGRHLLAEAPPTADSETHHYTSVSTDPAYPKAVHDYAFRRAQW